MTTAHALKAPAQRWAHGPGEAWLKRLARFGLACRGLVYLSMALLAVGIVEGRSGGSADESGALQSIGHKPFGRVLVLVIAAGFASLAVWEATHAVPRARPTLQRVVAAGKSVVYAALCLTSVAVVLAKSTSGSDQKVADITTRAMQATGGRFLVAAAGLAIGAGGIVLIAKAMRRTYDQEVDLAGTPEGIRGVIEGIGVAGMTARGVVFLLLGFFLVQAAVAFNPAKAKGFDAVLKSLAGQPYGPWLLGAVALGLAAFGVFSLIEVKFART